MDLSIIPEKDLFLLLSRTDYSLFESRLVSLIKIGFDQTVAEIWRETNVNPNTIIESLWEDPAIILQAEFLKVLKSKVGELSNVSAARLCTLIWNSFETLPDDAQIPAGFIIGRLEKMQAQSLIKLARSPEAAIMLGAPSCLTCTYWAHGSQLRCACNPCATFPVDEPNECRDYLNG